MRRVIAVIVLSLLTGTASYGAVSEDVYVRKDVFEVYMQNINSKFDIIMEELKAQRKGINDLTKAVSGLSERVTGLSERIDGVNSSLSERIDSVKATLSGRIDAVNSSLSARIDGLNAGLSGKIDGVDKRIDDLRNGLYLWLVAIGLVITVIAWPKVQEMLKKWRNTAPSITLEDVRRLIEENNVKLRGNPQV